jgi:hypothetical protein
MRLRGAPTRASSGRGAIAGSPLAAPPPAAGAACVRSQNRTQPGGRRADTGRGQGRPPSPSAPSTVSALATAGGADRASDSPALTRVSRALTHGRSPPRPPAALAPQDVTSRVPRPRANAARPARGAPEYQKACRACIAMQHVVAALTCDMQYYNSAPCCRSAKGAPQNLPSPHRSTSSLSLQRPATTACESHSEVLVRSLVKSRSPATTQRTVAAQRQRRATLLCFCKTPPPQ